MTHLRTLSASRLARLIREGRITSREACEAHIEQIERVNPRLNAVVETRFAEARAEAERADALVRSGADLPPLHGVPCTIKECFALAGMPQTSGLVSRRGYRAASDATAVARLREAGAIPLGVTNVSELCMWMETDNRVYGRTNNPYDPTRIVGGSSGGEGAIVGAGASPFGLGSDVGGSIRMPAFFNGVFGHKPTGGLVPATGQYPAGEGDALRYLTSGPLTRYAEDLYPLLRILAGPDGHDAGCRALPVRDPGTVDVTRLRVLDVADDGRTRVAPSLRRAQSRAADHLSRRGARVTATRFPAFARALEMWSAKMGLAAETPFAALMGGEGPPVRPGLELLRWAAGRSEHTLPAIGLALLEQGAALMPEHERRMAALGDELRRELGEALGDDGVLLYPSYAEVAPRHGKPLFPPVRWVYTALFNIMQLPVTQVPLGLDRRGLPLGIQVAAAEGNDHLTIAVALELERAFGGWQAPRALAA